MNNYHLSFILMFNMYNMLILGLTSVDLFSRTCDDAMEWMVEKAEKMVSLLLTVKWKRFLMLNNVGVRRDINSRHEDHSSPSAKAR